MNPNLAALLLAVAADWWRQHWHHVMFVAAVALVVAFVTAYCILLHPLGGLL